jgi:hypothetical protein
MTRLYFHLQMLADLEMKLEIILSSPISGETNWRRTRGDNGEQHGAALLSCSWREPMQTRHGGKPCNPAIAGNHANLVHSLFRPFSHTLPALSKPRLCRSKLGGSGVRSKCQGRASSFLRCQTPLAAIADWNLRLRNTYCWPGRGFVKAQKELIKTQTISGSMSRRRLMPQRQGWHTSEVSHLDQLIHGIGQRSPSAAARH